MCEIRTHSAMFRHPRCEARSGLNGRIVPCDSRVRIALAWRRGRADQATRVANHWEKKKNKELNYMGQALARRYELRTKGERRVAQMIRNVALERQG